MHDFLELTAKDNHNFMAYLAQPKDRPIAKVKIVVYKKSS